MEVFTSRPLDGRTVNSLKVATLESGTQRFVPLFIHFEAVDMVGAFTTPPTVTVGTSSGANDIVVAQLLPVGVLSLNRMVSFQMINSAGGKSLAPGASIWANVTVPAVGVGTVLNLLTEVVGYYR